VVTPVAKRKAVVHLADTHGMSERRACKAIGCCRMTMRYKTTRADDACLHQEHRRFGYRRLHVLLKREGLRLEAPIAATATRITAGATAFVIRQQLCS
jgi:putative transposase